MWTTQRLRRAGLPAAEILAGAVVGLTFARMSHAVQLVRQRPRYERCFWCSDFLVDMECGEDARILMAGHMLVCPSHPFRRLWGHPLECLHPLIEHHLETCAQAPEASLRWAS
jgi:hypothetical protein